MRLSIRHPLTVALAVGAAALVLAACGGGDGNGNANATPAQARSGPVSIRSVDGMNVLADSKGRTLYSTEVEKRQIHCTGSCTSFWDPVRASTKEARSAAADLNLDLGVVNRPDGGRQLTFNGLPLYRFAEEGAGQLKGNGFVDDFQGTHFEWSAATVGAGSGSAGSKAPSGGSGY
jgi:predicted lipoprotein with Yx(FWY)xxD motif